MTITGDGDSNAQKKIFKKGKKSDKLLIDLLSWHALADGVCFTFQMILFILIIMN